VSNFSKAIACNFLRVAAYSSNVSFVMRRVGTASILLAGITDLLVDAHNRSNSRYGLNVQDLDDGLDGKGANRDAGMAQTRFNFFIGGVDGRSLDLAFVDPNYATVFAKRDKI
jgi:hypothetical protein